MAAFRPSISAFDVLISYPRFFERSSHHSAALAYAFCDSAPSLIIFVCISVRSWRTFPTGLASTALALNGTADKINKAPAHMAGKGLTALGYQGLLLERKWLEP